MPQPTTREPKRPTLGADLLQAFLRKHSLTQFAASVALKVSDPTIHDWVTGTKRPRTHHREAIAMWTNGEVPVSAWLRDDEREAMANVRPFAPAPESSGSLEGDDTSADDDAA